MSKRFVSIWFRHLTTDWFTRKQPELKDIPFVLAVPDHGRMMVKASSIAAQFKGIHVGMVIADCRAILPTLQVFDDKPGQAEKLLKALAEWCLRYTPEAAVDLPDGIILNVSGCAHLWGGEQLYLNDIVTKLRGYGYDVMVGMADTIGVAWAIARFGKAKSIIETGNHTTAILPLPPAALRLESNILERMEKLGLYQIQSFIKMPRSVLRRRFDTSLLLRLDQATGQAVEVIQPVQPIRPYQERLPSADSIRSVKGIEIALSRLLKALCNRLMQEGKGLRMGIFKAYRGDGNLQQIQIGTNKASRNEAHLFRLFELKIVTMEPRLGFELFVLEAQLVEDISIEQEALWQVNVTDEDHLAEMLDRLGAKVGMDTIHRYLPAAHYWPERSIKLATSLQEKPATNWRTDQLRPVHLLPKPELIEVTVQLPDYPPMLFIYKGELHKIKKADGPERIDREWWLDEGLSRDYYCVEDEGGARYWLFRSGHYTNSEPQWFIHGFFA